MGMTQWPTEVMSHVFSNFVFLSRAPTRLPWPSNHLYDSCTSSCQIYDLSFNSQAIQPPVPLPHPNWFQIIVSTNRKWILLTKAGVKITAIIIGCYKTNIPQIKNGQQHLQCQQSLTMNYFFYCTIVKLSSQSGRLWLLKNLSVCLCLCPSVYLSVPLLIVSKFYKKWWHHFWNFILFCKGTKFWSKGK